MDYVSCEILDSILVTEEEHVDRLETQIDLIDKVGLQNYQQSQTQKKRPARSGPFRV